MGGRTEASNLCPACVGCNAFKLAFQGGVDPETGDQTRLFNPRSDRWEDHFRWSDADLSRIQALLDRGDTLDKPTAQSLVAEVRRLRAVVGEHLNVTIRPIAPQGADPSQAWFWAPEWQAGERAVDEEIAAGRLQRFDNLESFIANLMVE